MDKTNMKDKTIYLILLFSAITVIAIETTYFVVADIGGVGLSGGYGVKGEGGLAGGLFSNNGSSEQSGSYALLTTNGFVGINVSNPTNPLEVWGNINTTSIQLIPNGSPPTCNASTRGMLWYTQGTLGVADILNVCMKSVLNVYSWQVVSLI